MSERDKIMEDFPKLYAQKDLPMTHTCMCWGLEIGAGWLPIVRRLSEKLEAMIESGETPTLQCVQVKEKFGGLRFYTNISNDKVSELISEAYREASVTCEMCGKPGKEGGDGYIQTLCEKCHKI